VLDPYRNHLSKFWFEESINQIEEGHRYLLKMYNEDAVLHAALTSTTCRRLSTTLGMRCHNKRGSSAYTPSYADWPPPSPT